MSQTRLIEVLQGQAPVPVLKRTATVAGQNKCLSDNGLQIWAGTVELLFFRKLDAPMAMW